MKTEYKKRKKRRVEDVLSPSALSARTPLIMATRPSLFLFPKIAPAFLVEMLASQRVSSICLEENSYGFKYFPMSYVGL